MNSIFPTRCERGLVPKFTINHYGLTMTAGAAALRIHYPVPLQTRCRNSKRNGTHDPTEIFSLGPAGVASRNQGQDRRPLRSALFQTFQNGESFEPSSGATKRSHSTD